MTPATTTLRVLRDTGRAVWFGGSLMGVLGLNAAIDAVPDADVRATVAGRGWGRWAPLQTAALGAHLLGTAGMLATRRSRRTVPLAATELALTATAVAAVVGAGALARRLDAAPSAPDSARRRLRAVEAVVPLTAGALVVLGAVHDHGD